MKINEKLKLRRQELGLPAQAIAERVGLSVHEYDDLEAYEDEASTVVSLETLASVCNVIELPLEDLLELSPDTVDLPKDIVRTMMSSRHLTIESMSSSVGISEESIQAVMDDLAAAKTWVLDPIIDLAKAMDMKPDTIIMAVLKA